MHLVFDFDGTLVDSFHVAMGELNILADKFNFRKTRDDEIDGLRDLTSKELIAYLKMPIYKIPSVLRCARESMIGKMQILQPAANIAEMLHELYDKKISLGILTSNSFENVAEWLKHNKMQHLFNFIHVESSYFGKKRILTKIIKTYKIDKSQAFYVGDETRDVEAAKKCGINSIAVTWGFNTEKILLQQSPHFIARKPEDILRICSDLRAMI